MSERPLESLKTVADEYAHFLVEKNCNEKIERELREKLGFTDNVDAQNVKAEECEDNKDYVGIWKRTEKDGTVSYVRDKKYAQEYRFWADLQTIPAEADGRHRIVYVGESVARGYLYSPFFTPAKYLEDTLNKTVANEQFEVVDLARISIGIDELEELCEQSMALNPDELVVFAGNNWKYNIYPFSDEDAERITEGEKNGTVFEVAEEIIRKKFEQIIWKFMNKINELRKDSQMAVTFVIPEFNLKDWESIADDQILMWPGEKAGKFRSLAKEAEAAFQAGKEAEAVRMANDLAAMNPASPVPYEMLAHYAMQQGRIEDAQEYYEKRRDTSMYRRIFQPVCVSCIKEIMKEAAAKYQFQIVDLRDVMKEHLKEDVAGYNLFIDYCHMNAEGIKVSMTALAESILTREAGKKVEAVPSENMPSSKVSSQAYFLAAIHCAHMCEQSYDVLLHHLKKSLDYSSHIAELMVHYMDLVNSNVPWIYNKEAEYFCKLNLFHQYPLLYQPDDCTVMDIDLVNAMADALCEHGIDKKQETKEKRLRFFASHGEGVDLLSSYYREKSYYYSQKSSSYFAFEPKCYISAIDKATRFYFVADNKKDVEIRVTSRAKAMEGEKIAFQVNGTTVHESLASSTWTDTAFKVDRSLLNSDGVNELVVVWPEIDSVESEILESNRKRYSGDELIIRNSRPIYGELFRLAEYCL